MIADNLVHPSLRAPVYNQTIPVAMVHRPYAGRSPILPYREMVVILAITDEQDQMQLTEQPLRFFYRNHPATIPLPTHRGPWHSVLKNAAGYACACLLPALP